MFTSCTKIIPVNKVWWLSVTSREMNAISLQQGSKGGRNNLYGLLLNLCVGVRAQVFDNHANPAIVPDHKLLHFLTLVPPGACREFRQDPSNVLAVIGLLRVDQIGKHFIEHRAWGGSVRGLFAVLFAG